MLHEIISCASHIEDIEVAAISECYCLRYGALEKNGNNQCTVHVYLGVDADASFAAALEKHSCISYFR